MKHRFESIKSLWHRLQFPKDIEIHHMRIQIQFLKYLIKAFSYFIYTNGINYFNQLRAPLINSKLHTRYRIFFIYLTYGYSIKQDYHKPAYLSWKTNCSGYEMACGSDSGHAKFRNDGWTNNQGPSWTWNRGHPGMPELCPSFSIWRDITIGNW